MVDSLKHCDFPPYIYDRIRGDPHSIAPGAKLVRLTVPPVVGAVLLGMEQAGFSADECVRENLKRTIG